VSGLPTDVGAVLAQLFAEGRRALDDGDVETALATTASARTVASNKLPAGDRRERLLHGCARVEALLDAPEADAAAAYLAAMERRLEPPAE